MASHGINPVRERTLVILKPDAVARGLCGEIITRFERVGLKIVAAKMMMVSEKLAKRHYPVEREEFVRGMGEKTLKAYHEQGRDVKAELGTADPMVIGLRINQGNIRYLTAGLVLVLIWEGNEAVAVVRKLTGFAHPNLAAVGTIRGDFSADSSYLANRQNRAAHNLLHASGSVEEAAYEIKLWFKPEEIYTHNTQRPGNVERSRLPGSSNSGRVRNRIPDKERLTFPAGI